MKIPDGQTNRFCQTKGGKNLFVRIYLCSISLQAKGSVYNATGQLVYDEMKTNGSEVQLDLQRFEDGMYLIRVKTGMKTVEKKIVLNQ